MTGWLRGADGGEQADEQHEQHHAAEDQHARIRRRRTTVNATTNTAASRASRMPAVISAGPAAVRAGLGSRQDAGVVSRSADVAAAAAAGASAQSTPIPIRVARDGEHQREPARHRPAPSVRVMSVCAVIWCLLPTETNGGRPIRWGLARRDELRTPDRVVEHQEAGESRCRVRGEYRGFGTSSAVTREEVAVRSVSGRRRRLRRTAA